MLQRYSPGSQFISKGCTLTVPSDNEGAVALFNKTTQLPWGAIATIALRAAAAFRTLLEVQRLRPDVACSSSLYSWWSTRSAQQLRSMHDEARAFCYDHLRCSSSDSCISPSIRC